MLKLVAALGLLFVVSSGEDVVVRPPGALSDKDKLAKVKLPTLTDDGVLKSVNPSKCLDKKIYHDMDTLLKVKEEKDYLCAYIAYQANKKDGVGVGLYSSDKEATDRYTCFKESVNMVNEINGANLSYTAEVNKFSDMTPYEKSRYLGLGFRPNREEDKPADICGSSAGDDADASAKGVGSSADGDDADPPARGLGSAAGGAHGRGLGSAAGGAPAGGFGSSAGGVPPRGLGMGAPLRRRRGV